MSRGNKYGRSRICKDGRTSEVVKQRDINHTVDSEDSTWIIEKNDKVRFSMDHILGVKANYGHSLELPDMEMDEYRKDTKGHKRYIVHETYSQN